MVFWRGIFVCDPSEPREHALLRLCQHQGQDEVRLRSAAPALRPASPASVGRGNLAMSIEVSAIRHVQTRSLARDQYRSTAPSQDFYTVSFHSELIADAEAHEEKEDRADDGLEGGKHFEAGERSANFQTEIPAEPEDI